MPDQVFVESNELIAASRSMTTVNRAMGSIRATIINITNRQSSSWLGRASAQNTTNLRGLDSTLNRYLSESLRTAQALERAVSQYTHDEQARTGFVRQLDTSNIF